MSELPKIGSGTSTRDVLKVRSRIGWRGPMCGLRPVCWASIWYIGRPMGSGPSFTPWSGDGRVEQPADNTSIPRLSSPRRGPSTRAVYGRVVAHLLGRLPPRLGTGCGCGNRVHERHGR